MPIVQIVPENSANSAKIVRIVLEIVPIVLKECLGIVLIVQIVLE